VHKLDNKYTKLLQPVTVQYVFLWAWGRQTQGPPRAAHTLATPLYSAMLLLCLRCGKVVILNCLKQVSMLCHFCLFF